MKPLREFLIDTVKADPQGTERDHRELSWNKMSHEPTLMRAIFDYWFSNTYNSVEIQRTAHSIAILGKRRKRPVQLVPTVRSLKKVMLDLMAMHVPTQAGYVELKNATFAQCTRAGGWLALVGKQGKPNEIVGQKLTSEDVQHLWARGH